MEPLDYIFKNSWFDVKNLGLSLGKYVLHQSHTLNPDEHPQRLERDWLFSICRFFRMTQPIQHLSDL